MGKGSLAAEGCLFFGREFRWVGRDTAGTVSSCWVVCMQFQLHILNLKNCRSEKFCFRWRGGLVMSFLVVWDILG